MPKEIVKQIFTQIFMKWLIRIIPESFLWRNLKTRSLYRNANIVATPAAGNHKVAGVLTGEWRSWFVQETAIAEALRGGCREYG
jgi:hypothetical protein